MPRIEREPDEAQLEKLSRIVVKSFTATPDAISPFRFSILEWDIDNVDRGVTLHLNTVTIQPRGTSTITPTDTRRYSLIASLGNLKRTLESIVVGVDTSACRSAEVNRAILLIRAALAHSIYQSDEAYWPLNPRIPTTEQPTERDLSVSVDADGSIHFYMRFRIAVKHIWHGIDWAPDPTTTLSGRFRLGIANGRIVATGIFGEGDVDAPEWVWLLAAPLIELLLGISNAAENAAAAARKVPEAIAEFLNTIVRAADGYRLHSVKVGIQEGKEFVEITECPFPPMFTVPRDAPRTVVRV